MKKVLLIDGNNILFRSYYATAYTGNIMKNSKGFPTNALYGLINMMNKIINEENPEYVMIAFDKGKTFRHEKYDNYKGGRSETPDELKMQFPVAKKLVEAMGFHYFEIDNYEADDIIGTFAKRATEDKEYTATIISSDKDLLQLINDEVEVKLLKTNDYIRMTKQEFINTYGIEPPRMVDLKALMGDSSDNIPGVAGVGEKTAIKLLQEYGTLGNLYNNIETVKGKLKDKLIESRDDAFMSYDLATIYKDVPIDTDFSKIKYNGIDTLKYIDLLNELEFYSLIKKLDIKENNIRENIMDIDYKIVESMDDIILKDDFSNYANSKLCYFFLGTKTIKSQNKHFTQQKTDIQVSVLSFFVFFAYLFCSIKYGHFVERYIARTVSVCSISREQILTVARYFLSPVQIAFIISISRLSSAAAKPSIITRSSPLVSALA